MKQRESRIVMNPFCRCVPTDWKKEQNRDGSLSFVKYVMGIKEG